MKENNEIDFSPKHKDKLQKFESLKTSLAKLISERDILENTVRKNLEAIYATKIGINEYRQFKIECEIARLKRKIELFQAKLNHGEKPDISEIDKKLDEEYKKWEKEMSEMMEDIENSRKRLGALMSDESSIELHNTYRFLVKKLHPDVNTEETERSKMLWNRTMDAYLQNDIEELRAIKLLVEDINNDIKDYSEPDIDGRIDSLKKKIMDIMEYIKKIKTEFPFTIQDQITDENWVADKNAGIFKNIEKLENKKTELNNIIDELILKNMDCPDSDVIN